MPATTETIRVRLSFPMDRVKEPVLYHVVRDFGLVPNVLTANIEVRAGGTMVLELAGEGPGLEKALAWIRGCGVGVDRIGSTDL